MALPRKTLWNKTAALCKLFHLVKVFTSCLGLSPLFKGKFIILSKISVSNRGTTFWIFKLSNCSSNEFIRLALLRLIFSLAFPNSNLLLKLSLPVLSLHFCHFLTVQTHNLIQFHVKFQLVLVQLLHKCIKFIQFLEAFEIKIKLFSQRIWT